MAVEKYSQMAPAIALAGNEIVCISVPQTFGPVPYVTMTTTVAQIANIYNGFTTVTVSTRQLLAAMASDGVLYTAFDTLPPDPANSYNIAWWHSFRLAINDPFVTGFIQPAIGYTTAQMQALFALAATFPV